MPDTSQNKVSGIMNFQIDQIISAPCRLCILAALVPGNALSFTEMKATTSLSDGNLHVQTRKLADVGYIAINKIKKGRRSVTEFHITELGRERLVLHITKLQSLLNMDTGTRVPSQAASQSDDSAVWA